MFEMIRFKEMEWPTMRMAFNHRFAGCFPTILSFRMCISAKRVFADMQEIMIRDDPEGWKTTGQV